MTTATLPAFGVHKDATFKDYKSWDAWGSSSLKSMRRGPPARVLWEREHPKEETDETKRGAAVHCRWLTPDLFDATHREKPDGMTFASNVGKAWRDDPAHAGKAIITHDEWATVHAIVAALDAKEIVAETLRAADYREVSLLWECPTTGEVCKGRPDWIAGECLYDLKVSRYADGLHQLPYRAWSEGWIHQLEHNIVGAQACGLSVNRGRLVVVAAAAPHFVYAMEAKQNALDMAGLDNQAALGALKSCRGSGVWPSSPDSWEWIEPPAFALNDAAVFGSVEEVS